MRNIRQLIDLLRQIGDAATRPETQREARRAADLLFRGVVAASAAVEIDDPDDEPDDTESVEPDTPDEIHGLTFKP